jgi:hypothetical protein
MDEIKAPVFAKRLVRTEVERNSWAHTVPEGVDWRECFRREYWANNIERLRDGDSVEIHSFDHRVQFSMRILHINPATDPVTLEIAFLPIYPRDLVLPELERQRPARYETRLFAGQDGTFTVVDLRTGERLRDNPMSRADASALAANLERAALLAEGETLAGAFVRALTPGDTQLSAAMREAEERAAHRRALGEPKTRKRGRPRKPAREAAPGEPAPLAAAAEECPW